MTFNTWMNYGVLVGVPSYCLFAFFFLVYQRARNKRYVPDICDENCHIFYLISGFGAFGIFAGITMPFVILCGVIYLLTFIPLYIGDCIRKFLESGDKNGG